MLRQSKLYIGFVIEKHCYKISLFADNTVIYLNENQLQFKYVFDILETFGSKSGCQVNLNKSTAFYIGSSRGCEITPFSKNGLTWPSTVIKYLGVYIPINNVDENVLHKENFSTVTHKAKKY